MSPSFITLTTDFGLADHRAAALEASVWRHCPTEARVVAISHLVPAYDRAHATHLLGAVYTEFPPSTVHIVVVAGHEGVAGEFLAAHFREHYFLLPDNGLLTLLTDGQPAEVVRLPPAPGLPARAVLAAAAGHLVAGDALVTLGEPADAVVELARAQPRIADDRLTGHVVYVDAYGNLITNLTRELMLAVGAERPFRVRFGRETVTETLPHYGAAEPGDVACVFDSRGRLCIGLRRGSATALLGLGVDAVVEVSFT